MMLCRDMKIRRPLPSAEMQRPLHQAAWDVDAARGAVRGFAVRHLAAPGGVLVWATA
jgi:hypothetical protein